MMVPSRNHCSATHKLLAMQWDVPMSLPDRKLLQCYTHAVDHWIRCNEPSGKSLAHLLGWSMITWQEIIAISPTVYNLWDIMWWVHKSLQCHSLAVVHYETDWQKILQCHSLSFGHGVRYETAWWKPLQCHLQAVLCFMEWDMMRVSTRKSLQCHSQAIGHQMRSD